MGLISRDEVLKILCDLCNYALKVDGEQFKQPVRLISMLAIEDIKLLPIVKTTPKGEWRHEFTSFESGIGWHWRCSNCYWAVRNIRDMVYCPHCGAYMVGEENENNR